MNTNSESYSTEELLEIERICDLFETELNLGKVRSVDDYLSQAPLKLRGRIQTEIQQILNEVRTDQGGVTLGLNLPGDTGPEWNSRLILRGNRFELHQKLGVGGAGTVWRAYDRHLGRFVALKAPHLESEGDTKRFLQEARTVARLKHPRIVQVLDAGEDEFGCFMVSELIEGTSLAERMKQKTLELTDAIVLLVKVCDGLAFAHRQGIVHRDLKPHNILINHAGEPFIADFGLARELFAASTDLTRTGQVIGTPAFMAPEQAAGGTQTADPRTDIYSLGVILFQVLTGELPFRGDLESILYQLKHQESPNPKSLNPHVPDELDLLCGKCLQKKLSERIPSVEFLQNELQRYLQNEPILSKPTSVWGKLRKVASKNPGVAWLSVTILGLVLTITMVAWIAAYSIYQAKNEEYHLRVEAEIAKREAELAKLNESKARERAEEARRVAEQQSRRANADAALTQQSVEFLESILEGSDPVSAVLGTTLPNLKGTPTLIDLLDEAAKRVRTDLSDQPRSQARLMETIARSYRGIGRYDVAKQLLEQATLVRNAAGISKDPEASKEALRGRFCTALIHQDLGEAAEAEKIYREILQKLEADESDPSFVADLYFQLGWSLHVQRKREESKSCFQRSLDIRLKIYPNEATPVQAARIGIEISESNKPGEISLEVLQEAVQNNDRFGGAALKYVQIIALRRVGKFAQAAEIYRELLGELKERFTEESPIYVLALGEYADTCWKQGDFKSALPAIQTAIEKAEKLAPRHEQLRQARIVFASELLRGQRLHEARHQFYAVKKIDDASGNFSSTVYEGLAWTNALLDNSHEAIELGNSLLSQKGWQPDWRLAWWHYTLARIKVNTDRFEEVNYHDSEALRLASAVEELPEDGLALERLATIFAKNEQFERAETLFKKSLEFERANRSSNHPHVADRLNSYAFLLQRVKRDSEAFELLEEALAIREKNLPKDDVRLEQTMQAIEEIRVRRSR